MPKARPTDTTSAPAKTPAKDTDSGDPYAGTAPAKRPASRREDDPET